MNSNALAFLSLRVVAIYLFILFVRMVANGVSAILPIYLDTGYFQFETIFIYFSLSAVIFLLLSIFLWVFAKRLSNYLVPEAVSGNSGIIDGHHIEPIAYSIIGVILIAFSIPDLSRLILQSTFMERDLMEYASYRGQMYYSLIEKAVQLLLGILLVLQANSIKNLLKKAREIGVKK